MSAGGRPLSLLRILYEVRLQIGLFALLSLIYGLSLVGVTPSPSDLQSELVRLFDEHGVWVVAPVSFVENLGGLNIYFPGSVAILTAMALTSGNLERAILIFFVIVLPSFTAHQLNFLGGRLFGASRADFLGENRLDFRTRRGLVVGFLATLWHPHFTALTAMVSGAEGMCYRRFLAYFTPIFLGWNTFWGVTMYFWGAFARQGEGMFSFFWAYIVGWAAWDIWKLWKRQ